MILEYSFHNYAWGKVQITYLFDIDKKQVLYSKNNSELKVIATIEQHEQIEMLSHIGKITNLNFHLSSQHSGFDAGSGEYFLILNHKNKIKLGEKGDYTMRADNNDIINLVNLIDKYVKLVNDTILN